MLKKTLLGLCLAGLVGAFVLGHEVVSYVRTGCQNIRNTVKAEVPIEFEIDRARTLVEGLVPDIRQCMHLVAEQQVDIERLHEQIASKETDLAKQKQAIMALRTDLSSGKSAFVYARYSFTADDVKRDLASRFDRFKTAEEVRSGVR
jgi:hypothetical protein